MTVVVSGSEITFADATTLSSAPKTPVTYRTTETSDVALATCASGGTQVGSNISVEIPTSGYIRVSLIDGELDNSGTAMSVGIGIDVNGTTYFRQADGNGSSNYAPCISSGSAVDTNIKGGWGYGLASGGSGPTSTQVVFDISTLSIATGSQTLKVLMGDEANSSLNGAGVLNGSTGGTAVLVVDIFEV